MSPFVDTLPAGDELPVDHRAESSLPTGTLLAGRYQLEQVVGSGGMGHVFAARDLFLDETIALKVLRAGTVDSAEGWKMALHELRIARKVTHANVARLFDVGQDGEHRFLTMELVRGQSLAARLREVGRLPVRDVLRIAQGMAAGLQAIHAAGVVHRDLKPDNVLIEASGRVVVTDFGISQVAQTHAPTGQLAGTPTYMAPEQVSGQPLDGRADIYAFGLVVYEMLTGRPAWVADTWLRAATIRLDQPPPRVATFRPDAPGPLQHLVNHCLAQDRQERLASADLLVERLRRIGQANVSGIHPTPRSLDALQLFMRARHEGATHWYGDARDAVSLLQDALASAPNDPMLLSALAMAEARLMVAPEEHATRLEHALQSAQAAVRLAPEQGEPHVALAVVALSRQYMALALAASFEALTHAPQLARAHEVIGRILLETGPLDAGELQLQMAMAFDPATTDPQWELVRGLGLQARWQQATELMELPPRSENDRAHREVHRARLSMWAGQPLCAPKMPTLPDAELSPPFRYALICDRLRITGQVSDADRGYALQALARTAPGSRLRMLFAQLACELLSAQEPALALSCLQQAVAEGLQDAMWMQHCPMLAPLRALPAWTELDGLMAARAARLRQVWEQHSESALV